MQDIEEPVVSEIMIEEPTANWRARAIANHQRELDDRRSGRFHNNPRLYGHTR